MSDKKKVQSKKGLFPLTSGRLKLYQLQQLAQALELPIKAPSNDLRVMVEENLRAMDRNPLNTQVVVDLKEKGTENLLQLHPIPTERPIQIAGVDIMELSVTTRGNKYVIVFHDLFTKWSMVYPTSGQKAERIARLLVEEIVPIFSLPEAHLSDRVTNLLSLLIKDVYKFLGIEKLNMTVHHPECDGATESFY